MRERGGTRRDAIEWIKSLGIDLASGNGAAGPPRRRVAEYVYHDRIGEPLYRVVRWGPEKTFTQERYEPATGKFVGGKGCMAGVQRVPYRLHEWADETGRVFVVEGEKDADRLASLGELATTNAGGAGKWPKDFAGYFAGREVIICGDNDQAGKKHVRQVAASLRPVARSLRIVWVPPLVGKDVRDWLDAGHTLDGAALYPLPQPRNRATVARARAGRAAETGGKPGHSGRVPAMRCSCAGWWARTQRRNFSISPSRAGCWPSRSRSGSRAIRRAARAHTLDRVLEFFPDEAVIKFTGMSERALVYRDDDYQHRTLVIYEVTGLQEGKEDNLAAYFVRSLLSEGRLEYDVTIRGEGGQYTTQRIVKEGPTNLIFTTTRTKVHAENETRVLSLNTDDSTEQTKNVLAALVKEGEHSVDLAEWRQIQSWLQVAERRVTIPYGKALAELVPPVAVRLRRDFGAVLALIRAHAILHQLTRERDENGRIVATIADYAAVRALVAGVISEGIGAGVGEVVRETVEAVRALSAGGGGVMVTDIARKLEIDKSNASRRVRRAADGGYIRNAEDKRGRPGRWIIGDPLPDTLEVLPDPDELRSGAQHATARNPESGGIPGGCAVAPVQEGIQTHGAARERIGTCAYCFDAAYADDADLLAAGGVLHFRCTNLWLRSQPR